MICACKDTHYYNVSGVIVLGIYGMKNRHLWGLLRPPQRQTFAASFI
jgi:hypothetical protein